MTNYICFTEEDDLLQKKKKKIVHVVHVYLPSFISLTRINRKEVKDQLQRYTPLSKKRGQGQVSQKQGGGGT